MVATEQALDRTRIQRLLDCVFRFYAGRSSVWTEHRTVLHTLLK